jgi:hypothetical protein
MQFRKIIAIYSENRMKHMNTICGQHAKPFNVKAGGIYNNQCVLNS